MTTRSAVRRTWFLLAIVIPLWAAACGGGSGNNNGNPDGGTGDALSDNEPCTPMALRCNGNVVEQCNAAGTMWVPQMTCSTFCADGACALDGLDVGSDMTLDGIVHVKGAVTVHAGATLSTPTGDLTIFADSISVEMGGSIAAAPTGMTPDGAGEQELECEGCQTEGGSYGSGDRPWGSTTDTDVEPGSPGALMGETTAPAAALGGGAIRLLAPTMTIAGQITANGANGGSDNNVCLVGGGGGSGGGILLFGDHIIVTGSISAAGGVGGVTRTGCGLTAAGQSGGNGRVKILHGDTFDVSMATITGVTTEGLAPPLPLTSTSHPDPTYVYNDGFVSLDMTWAKPFTVMGYYVLIDSDPSDPPTAATGAFQAAEKVSFPASAVSNGDNYVHVVSVDAQSAISTVESVFHVQINTLGPSMTSQSHPSQTTFSNNTNPFFMWSYPQGDINVSGAYYVFDHFGTTVPTTTDMMLPATQKQLLQSNVAAGVWVLHVVSVDTQGRLTKVAGNYRVNIGTDPGSGGITGHLIDGTSQPVAGATVTVNRGLYTTTSDSAGDFTLSGVTAGMWELSATMGALTATKQITVTSGMTTSGDMTMN